MSRVTTFLMLMAVLLGGFASQASADNLFARVRGVVVDSSGAVLPNVSVTATNLSTGIATVIKSGSDGLYEFLNLPTGQYMVSAEAPNFKTFRTGPITLTLDQVYVQNITMEVGATTQVVEVEANTVQVDTTSMEHTQVITGTKIADMPLNGRNWITLQQLQPGVVASSDRFTTNYATNGSQTQQNSYLVNGLDTNDIALNTPLVIPSPDAIAEFDLVTSTINPEYGRNSGAILNAEFKSGTNSFHGDLFEFYRDTFLNTKPYFSPTPTVFHQNQFGGTVGGPIWKNHTFGFFSYQGRRFREIQPGYTGGSVTQVFTDAERGGDFSADVASPIFPDFPSDNPSPFALVGEDGTTYPAGTPFSTIFPTGHIPSVDFNPLAVTLLDKYVPHENANGNQFQWTPVESGNTDQYIYRVDHQFNDRDRISTTGLIENSPTTSDISFDGGTLPGFAELDAGHTKQFTASWIHTFNSTTMNEFRAGYARLHFFSVQPVTVAQPSSFGFDITPQLASGASMPQVQLDDYFTIGFSYQGPQPRADQTYQITDNFSKNLGKHAFKFGFEGRRFQEDNPFAFVNNGYIGFDPGAQYSSGNDGVDYLLGIPATNDFEETSGGQNRARGYEYYSYFQDQFRVLSNLTLTYGFGWDVETPLVDTFNHNRAIACFRPGQVSNIYPPDTATGTGAPAGIVYPGDPGCPPGGYTTTFRNVGPRVGFAWSPDWGKFSGGPGKLSIRGGYGVYYNRSEEEQVLQNLQTPPFSLTSFGVTNPSFVNPYQDVTGTLPAEPNPFPYAPPPAGAAVDFSQYEPFTLNVFDPHTLTPTSENFNLTVQRQLPAASVLTVAYVGALAQHLEQTYDANPGVNPAGCAADPTCVATRAAQRLYFPGNFTYEGDIYGGIGVESTLGTSNYNSLQISLNKATTHGLSFLLAYTYSHSLDYGSGFENAEGNSTYWPADPGINYGDSVFDARHRLVISYTYQIPSPSQLGVVKTILGGWQITGATSLQTGFPIAFSEGSDYHSLVCDGYNKYGCPDRPDYVGGFKTMDARTLTTVGSNTAHYYFLPSEFSREVIGTIGDYKRDTFHGPGLNNTDLALFKNIKLTEAKSLQLRLESFNTFNHTQFSLPSGNIDSSLFGTITGAAAPRIVQLAGKFYF